MGALPRKKLTKSRSGKRVAHYGLSPVYPSRCPQCRAVKLSHTACPSCGYYRGRRVKEVAEK